MDLPAIPITPSKIYAGSMKSKAAATGLSPAGV